MVSSSIQQIEWASFHRARRRDISMPSNLLISQSTRTTWPGSYTFTGTWVEHGSDCISEQGTGALWGMILVHWRGDVGSCVGHRTFLPVLVWYYIYSTHRSQAIIKHTRQLLCTTISVHWAPCIENPTVLVGSKAPKRHKKFLRLHITTSVAF